MINNVFSQLKEKEKILFDLLKSEVAKTFLKENPAQYTDISKWKGEDIVRFQEDLLHKVKGRVSEKWFYNYFRNDIQKLPRIDMLNLLSEYVGYKNWADFTYKNQKKTSKKKTYKPMMLPFALLLLAIIGYAFWPAVSHRAVFCFTDDAGNPVDNIRVIQLFDKQSDRELKVENQCVSIDKEQKEIRLKIVSPYYKDVLIIRTLHDADYKERIRLHPDLYALLIQSYSKTDTKDWEKRRTQLEGIIADDALIYRQWFGAQKGIEIFDKDTFIGQLCIPTGWVRNIDILEIEQENNQIVKLRFTLHSQEK